MRKSVVTVLAAPAVLWAAAIATPAAAEEAIVRVNYGDLDLADPADVATLETRIAAAVKEVCNRAEPRIVSGDTAWKECKAKSLADAMEQVAAVVP